MEDKEEEERIKKEYGEVSRKILEIIEKNREDKKDIKEEKDER